MKNLLIAIFILFLAVIGCQAKVYDGKEYIGLKYLKCPNGLTEHQGCVIEIDGNYDSDYCLEYLTKGKIQMVWLEKAYRKEGGKVHNYQVLDVIVSPEIKKDYIFSLSSSSLNKKYDPLIVTYVEKSESEYWKVLYAWKINVQKEKFEKIITDGITSINTISED
jgi:hypothetical protein